MGIVDSNFKPSVPVFDSNVALGRKHTRRVIVDNAEGTLAAMDYAGIARALVYSPHSVAWDSQEGNQILMEMVKNEPRLVPQYVCNPSTGDLESFSAEVKKSGVTSVRMCPKSQKYPFRDWVVKDWFEWLSDENIPLFIPVLEFDPVDLHDTIKRYPGVTVVLCDVHYSDVGWALPLLRSLPNVCIEISRFVIADGIARLLDTVDYERVLYGSKFPDHPMPPQLYNLHKCGLSTDVLTAICAGNLIRLLGE